MAKGLYFTAVVFSVSFLFFFLFFRRLISEVTERISTKLGHIFTYDYNWKKMGRTSSAFTPTGCVAKNALWDRLWTLTEHISATEHDSNNRKKLVSLQDSPTCLQICWALVLKRLRTVGEFLPTPSKFSQWQTLPALPHGRYTTDSRQTLARATTVCSGTSLQSRTTECRAGSRWALPRI